MVNSKLGFRILAFILGLTVASSALPEGGDVVQGSATITTSGNTQTIYQGSNRAIINWNGFSINVGELVNFVQPSSASAVLNRVIGQDPSQILGALRANGQVFLINPNGIVFGQSATIDVGSLVVSTLDMANDDFMNGRLVFEQRPDKDLAAVINRGRISIDENGFLVLTGPMVANEGVILAKVGQVALAGGTQTTVSFDASGMLHIAIPSGGEMDGLVTMTQQDAGAALSNVVTSSQAEAGRLVVRDGVSYLEVESGTVANTGTILAEGREGKDGGRVVLNSTANTILADNSLISVSGEGLNSSGGEVYLLSEGWTEAYLGSTVDISAGETGDGGFAEQSGNHVVLGGDVVGEVKEGARAHFLIDPPILFVEDGALMGQPPPDTVFEADLEAGLQTTLMATDGIFINNITDNVIDLPADTDFFIDVGSGNSSTAAVFFADPNDVIRANGTGSISVTTVDTSEFVNLGLETTGTGGITITAGGGNLSEETDLTTVSGDININTGGGTIARVIIDVEEGTAGITSTSGNIIVDTGGGDIDGSIFGGTLFDTVNGDVMVSTGGGSIFGDTSFSSVTGNVTINTGGGDIDGALTDVFTGSGVIDVDTLNGSVLGDTYFSTITGGIDVNLGTGTIADQANFPTAVFELDGPLSVASGNVNLNLTSGVLSGTLTGGAVAVASNGNMALGNLTNTGSSYFGLGSYSGNITRNGTDLVTASFVDFFAPMGNVGTAVNPIVLAHPTAGSTRVEGTAVQINVDSAGDLTLGYLQGEDLRVTAGGQVTLDDYIYFHPGGFGGCSIFIQADSIQDSGGEGGYLDSPMITLIATTTIGSDFPLYLLTEDLVVTAPEADIFPDGPPTTAVFTNLPAPPGPPTSLNGDFIISSGEGFIFEDLGGVLDLSADSSLSVTYNTVGDLSLQSIRSEHAVSIETTGSIDQGVEALFSVADPTLRSTGGNIDVTLRVPQVSGSPSPPVVVDATADAGNITLTGDDAGLEVNASAPMGNITINETGNVVVSAVAGNEFTINGSSATVVTSVNTPYAPGITADLVTVRDVQSIDIDTRANRVSASTVGGELRIDNSGSVVELVDLASMGGDLTVTNDAGINVRQVGAGTNNVDISTTMGPIIQLSNTITGASITLAASGSGGDIDVDTDTGLLTANGSGSVTIDNTSVLGPTDMTVSAVGSATVTHNGDLTGTFTGSSVDLVADDIDVDVTTSLVTAVATTGDVDIDGQGAAALEVGGSAVDVFDLDHGGNITTRQITADNILLDSLGLGDIIRSSGRLTATTDVAISGLDINVETESPVVGVVGNNVRVDNFGGAVGLVAVTQDLIFTSSGDVTVDRAHAATGNINIGALGHIEATADPNPANLIFGITGNTLSAPNGIITLQGTSVNANSTTSTLNATATNGDLNLSGNDNANIDITAMSTNGNTTVNETANVTGSFTAVNGNVAVTTTGSLNANLTGNVVSTSATDGTLNVTTPTLSAVTTSGSLSIMGANAGIDITGTSAGDLTINDTGAITGTLTGNVVTVNGGSVNVNLNTNTVNSMTSGGNITLNGLMSGGLALNVNAGAGNVNVDVVDPGALTGSVVGNIVTLDGTSINVNTTANQIDAVSVNNLTVNNSGSAVEIVQARAGDGDVNLTNDNNITTRVINANNSSVTTTSGDIASLSDSINGGTVTVNTGNGSVNVDTAATNLNSMATGNINIDNTSANVNANVDSSAGNVTLTQTGNLTGSISSPSLVDLSAADVNVDVTTPVVNATANTGNVALNGTNPSLAVNANAAMGAVTVTGTHDDLALTANAGGNVTVNNTGNVAHNQVTGRDIDITASGNITRASGRLVAVPDGRGGGGNVILSGNNVTAHTEAHSLMATASAVGDIVIDNFVTDPISPVSLDAGGNVTFTTTGSAVFSLINGMNIDLTTGGPLVVGNVVTANRLRANGPTVTLTDVDVADITANASAGDVNIDGTGNDLMVGGTASGSFNVTDVNNLSTDPILALDINLTANGDITNFAGTLTANTVTLSGANVAAQTQTGALNVTGTGLVDIDNFSALVDPVDISTAGDIDFTTNGAANLNLISGNNVSIGATGAITRTGISTITGNTVSLTGGSIDARVNTNTVTANTTGGTVNLVGVAGGLNVNSNAAGGPIIVSDPGAITGNLTGGLVLLNGGSINVNTVASQLNATSTAGNVTVSNTGGALHLINVTATGGDTSVINDGDLNTRSVNGNNVTLTSTDGNITTLSNSINGATVNLNAANGTVNADTRATLALNSNADGNINIDNTSAVVAANLISANGGVTLTQTGNLTGNLAGNSVQVSAADVDVGVTTPQVSATATSGDVNLTGANANLQVTADAGAGDVNVNNTGNVATNQVSGANVNITAGGGGDITRNSGRLVGNLNLVGNDVTAETEAGSLMTTATGDIMIDNFVTDPVGPVSLSAGGDIDFSTVGAANFNLLSGNNVALTLGAAFTGANVTGNLVSVTATSVDLTDVNSAQLTTNATAGDVNVDGTGADMQIGGSATGDFTVGDVGNLSTNQISATNINLNANGNITNNSGRLVGNTVTLNGAGVAAQTEAGALNVTGTGLVDIDNFSALVNPVDISTGGDIDFNTSGAANLNLISGNNVNIGATGPITRTGISTITGNTVSLMGGSIDARVNTNTVTANTTGGNVNLVGLAGGLNVNSNAAGGNISVTDPGAITGNLTGSLVTLNGGSVNVNTMTRQLDATSTAGGVTVSNTGSDLEVVNANATGGDVNVTNDGNLNTRTVSGNNTSLTSTNGNVTSLSDSIKGATVTVSAANGTVNVDTQATANLNSNADGNITIDNASGAVNANLNSASGGVMLTQTGNLTGNLAGTSVQVSAADVNVGVTTPQVNASATSGNVNLTGANANLDVTADAGAGDVTVNNTGNVATNQVNGANVNITAAGGGNITRNSGRLVGNVNLVGNNVTAQTEAGSLMATATGDLIIDNFVTDPVGPVSLSAGGNLNFSTVGAANFNFLNGTNVSLVLGSAFTGANVTGNLVSVTATSVDLTDVSSAQLTVNASAGDVNLDGTGADMQVGGSATGDFNVSDVGNLSTDQINGTNVNLSANGAITNNSGTIAGNTVSLSGTSVSAQTQTGQLSASSSAGDLNVGNTGGPLEVTSATATGGDVNLTNDGDLNTRVVSGNNVNLTSSNGNVNGLSDSINGATVTVNAANGSVNVDTQATANLNSNANGSITIDNASAAVNANLNSANGGVMLTQTGNLTGNLAGTSVQVSAADVNVGVTTPQVNASATSGNVNLTGANANLEVTADAGPGDVTVNNTGNVATNQVSGANVNITAAGGGNITRTSGRLVGNVNLVGNNVTAQTEAGTLMVTATGDLMVDNFVTDPVGPVSLSSGANLNFTTPGAANFNLLNGTNLTLNLGDAFVGANVTGNLVSISATSVDLTNVNATQLTANASAGDVNVDGTGADLRVGGSATGNFTVTDVNNLSTDQVNANNVSLTANGGVTNNSGRLAGSSVNLNGNTVSAQTQTGQLGVQASGAVQVDNQGALSSANISTTGNVALDNNNSAAVNINGAQLDLNIQGDLTGSLTGTQVNLTANSADADLDAQGLNANATAGNLNFDSQSSSDLTVNASAPAGDFGLSHQGDILVDQISATNVQLTTPGDIRDITNTIIADNIDLNANNIDVNTEAGSLNVQAQGFANINNSDTDVSPLNIQAGGNVNFITSGGLVLGSVLGSDVFISANGNILGNSGALVSGQNVQLSAGGTITPDVTAPLEISAGVGLTVSANGSTTIAGALTGTVGSGGITVNLPSGPIYFDGQYVGGNPVPASPSDPPPSPPPSPAVNEVGQQNGQLVDDGDVGTADNDGLAGDSPTQQLVAQISDALGGGDGAPAGFLITLSVDELGEVQVTLTESSPFDQAADNNPDLAADEILDLDTDELPDIQVSVLYDPTNDQIVMAVDLSADDLIDLGLDDITNIPVNLTYNLNADPTVTDEDMSAGDIIDLSVDELGSIPITLLLTRDSSLDVDSLTASGLQELMTIPLSLVKMKDGAGVELLFELDLAELGDIPVEPETED